MKLRYVYFLSIIISMLFMNIITGQSADFTANKDNTIFRIFDTSDTLSNGSGQHFYVGLPQYTDELFRRGLVAFDISSIPQNATINSAMLTLHMSRTRNGAQLTSIHRVLSDWGEGATIGQGEGSEGGGSPSQTGDANWVHTFYPNSFWDSTGGDFSPAASDTLSVIDTSFYTWGSTGAMVADVQHWLDSGQSYGWIIIGNEDTSFTSKRFDTHENSVPSFRPTLHVEYNTPPEILPLPDVTFVEDGSASIEISELYEYVSDSVTPDSLLLVNILSGDFINVSLSSNSVELSAPQNWFGDDTLIIEVSDGQLTSEAQIKVHVSAVNDIPFFSDLPDTVRLDSTWTIPLWDYLGDIESADSLLIFEFDANDSLQIMYNALNGALTLDRFSSYFGQSFITITITDDSSAQATDSILVIIDAINSIEDKLIALPQEFQLLQNYPNPFNPSTLLRFALPKAEHVTLAIYNALGQKILTLLDGPMSSGNHEYEFKAQHLASGIYFYRIEAGEFTDMKKMILLK